MIEIESPNFNDRETKIDMIVLHYTGMESLSSAIDRLTSEESEVSCHYLIAKNGDIYKLVDEEKRAWHAGVSYWQGETDINSRSIGVEIENKGHNFGYEEFNDIQIASTVSLCKTLIEKYNIKPQDIVGHSDIAPSRKMDPGELFPWKLLAENEVGFYPNDELIDLPSNFDYISALSEIGYKTKSIENTTTAFKRHYIQDDVNANATPLTLSKIYKLWQFSKASNAPSEE